MPNQNNQVTLAVNADPSQSIAAAQAVAQAWMQTEAVIDRVSQKMSSMGGGMNGAAQSAAGGSGNGNASSAVNQTTVQSAAPAASPAPSYVPPMPRASRSATQTAAFEAASSQRASAVKAYATRMPGVQQALENYDALGGTVAGRAMQSNMRGKRMAMLAEGYELSNQQDYAQKMYGQSVPTSGNRGPRNIDDLHEQALRENEVFDKRKTANLRKDIEAQVADESAQDARLNRSRAVSDNSIRDWMGGGRGGGPSDPNDPHGIGDNPFNYNFGSPQQAVALRNVLRSQSYQRSIIRAGLYGVADATEHYFQTATNETLTGQADPLGMGTAYGAIPGAVLGGAIGGFFGPLAGAAGAAVGARAGGAAANFFQAPYARDAQVERNAMNFAYATGQNPSRAIDEYTQNRFGFKNWDLKWNESDMDETFETRDDKRGWWTGFRTRALRQFGLYQGNDRASNQDEMKVAGYYQSRALERGEVMSSPQANAQARAYLENPEHVGQLGIGLLPTLQKYDDANNKYGGNIIDIMQAVGVEATLTGRRNDGLINSKSLYADVNRNLRVDEREERLSKLSLQGAEADFGTTGLSGNLRGGADWDAVKNAKQDYIKTLRKEIEDASRIPGGADSELVKAKEAAIKGVASEIASINQQQTQYNYQMGMANVGVSQSRTNLVQTGTNLWGGAGSFTSNVLPMQRQDIDAAIGVEQAKMNASKPGSPNYLSAQTNINNLNAQRMGLGAANQGADIARGDLFTGTANAQAGLSAQQANLYGTGANIGAAGQGQLAVNAQTRQRLLAQLNNSQSESIRQSLMQRLFQLDQSDMGIRAGVSQGQYGREGAAQALGAGQAGLGIEQSTAFGTDDVIAGAYAGSRANRGQTQAQLTMRLNDPNLPEADKARIRQTLLGLQSEGMREGISEREVGLGRSSSRYDERRGDAAYGMDVARSLGNAGQYRSALSRSLGSLDERSSEIQSELDRGGLTFDQQHRLRSEQQGIRRERFTDEQRGIDEGYQKEDLEGYDLQHLRLSGARRRAAMLPFGGGNRMGLDLRAIGEDNTRMGQLRGRYQELQRGGNLSPERRMALEREYDSLDTDRTGIVAGLANGMEDYLPGLSAGRPSRFTMHDSYDLAAMHLGMNGSMIGRYGARNGQQLAAQRAPFQALANMPGLSSPNTGNQMTLDSPQVVSLLQQILQKMNGGGANAAMKPGEQRGAVLAALNQLASPQAAYRGTGN